MADKTISKEEKQNRRRTIIAFLVSLFGHISFFLLIAIFNHKKPVPEKIVVMKIRLSEPEKVGEQSGAISTKPKASAKTRKSKSKTIPATPGKNQEKKTQKEIKEKPTKEIPVIRDVKNNQNDKIVDIIQKKIDEETEKNKQEESDFFNNANKKTSESSIPDIGDLDSLLEGIANTDTGSKENDTGNTPNASEGKGKGIQWGNGGNRSLKNSSPIVIPDDIKNAGLKFTVQISFTVLPEGIISSSQILKSSGNARWDEIIRNQFSRWTFEKSNSGNANGTISIEIGY
ncbi:MAG: hypothetical protein A2015_11790 [Spirochaetes bacterium GWF1_31_7]|nr:MAG: hypothetical protein A2Y30_15285 [Spirochaetes bacterium GWE1_32_154]OHD49100.1 MAG: hypothetical protein A2015_11790 [Spirochaetes bacterium GWF1_31_7]OHD50314.1 MAG: hypothetical protein A2Y29_13335 [Spirochaetes bacterium GWE2_31_10]HBD93898.1 hypothetical protein [Spirochaetia bacterium]HBI38794.1 hypothetical protein [Spirochaetia bacterium]